MNSSHAWLAGLLGLFPPSMAAGLDWPDGQVFPRFAAYSALDVVDISNLAFDQKVAITALQGVVNRNIPRIYVLDGPQSGEGKNFWSDRITVAKTPVANPLSLFSKYQAAISGLCVYDPAVAGSINAAVTAAGVTDCAVASPALAATLSGGAYGIPITLDLRSLRFANDRAALAWAKAEYGSRCSHRMLAGMKPGVHYPLMDYIVANRALCVWLDPGEVLDQPLLNAIFADMPVNGVYVGWWAGETRGVAYASGYGVMTFATDWFANATVHGGGSAALANLPALAAPPGLSNKCHIALILSDGDNLQEQEHLFPIRWASSLRGTFPVSWTQSPGLADFAPAMLNYFYSTRTANDCFITGPSGVGYVLPENMKPAHFREFARLSETYFKKTGMRTATIWGNAAWASDSMGLYCPSILGMANKQGGAAPMGARYWAGGIASVEMAPDYASLGQQIIDEIRGRMAAWNKTKPLFIAPQLNANVAGLDELKKVYDAFKDNADVVFVRADQLFQLLRAANPTAIRLGAPPQWQWPARGGGRFRAGLFITPLGWNMDLRGRMTSGEVPQ